MSELKPCPLCGKRRIRFANDGEKDVLARAWGRYAIICDGGGFECDRERGCGLMSGYSESETAAIAAWNRRSAPDEASRAPAPQEQPAKGDDTLGALIDLHGQVSHFCETEGEADFETGRATRAIKAAKAARAPAPISDLAQRLRAEAEAQATERAPRYCPYLLWEAADALAQSQGGQPATSREQGDDARRLDECGHRISSLVQWVRDHPKDYQGIDERAANLLAELRKGADRGITPATEGAKP